MWGHVSVCGVTPFACGGVTRAAILAVVSQYVVSLLAERPEHELQAIREKARAEVERLQVEIDQIDQALAKQQQAARRTPRRGRRSSASGGTRERVLGAVAAADGDTISPAEIIAALRSEGSTVTSGAIRNMIRRLMDEGEIVRIREGAYKTTSQNGSAEEPNLGPTENEGGEPLSPATHPQEGTSGPKSQRVCTRGSVHRIGPRSLSQTSLSAAATNVPRWPEFPFLERFSVRCVQ
jgi:hypothetical protein